MPGKLPLHLCVYVHVRMHMLVCVGVHVYASYMDNFMVSGVLQMCIRTKFNVLVCMRWCNATYIKMYIYMYICTVPHADLAYRSCTCTS